MPNVSDRAKAIKDLEELMVVYENLPHMQEVLNFVPQALSSVLSKRFYHEPQPVLRTSSWTPHYVYGLHGNRARRDLRCEIESYEFVLERIRSHPVFHNRSHNEQRDVETQLQVFLKFVGGTGDTHWKIAQHFGIGEGFVSKAVGRVKTAILSLESDYIVWPDAEERKLLIEETYAQFGVLGSVGIIDGTAIELQFKPQECWEQYYSRKGRYCESAQVVCDKNRLIRMLGVGFPGALHDSRQFKLMDIFLHPEKYFSDGEFMTGDVAYPLLMYLLHGYKKPAANLRRNYRFNHFLSSIG